MTPKSPPSRESALAPCPFCGAGPLCSSSKVDAEPVAICFECPNGCSVSKEAATYEGAIAIWNTRVPTQSPPDCGPDGARTALEDLTSAMRFVLAFYEPGQRHLDTVAWKSAEAGARAAFAKAETALRSVQPRDGEKLGAFAADLASKQQSLGGEFAKVLATVPYETGARPPSMVDREAVASLEARFLKVVKVMKGARNSQNHLMSVWPDDMKAAEDVAALLAALSVSATDGGTGEPVYCTTDGADFCNAVSDKARCSPCPAFKASPL